MNIEMPSKREKEKSIDIILDKGINSKVSTLKKMLNIYKNIGLKNMLWDTLDCWIIAIVGTISMIVLVYLSANNTTLSTVFMLSPLFYLVISILTNIKERHSQLYEIKMTCKYTIMQIIAVRMTWFSLIGVIICAFGVAVASIFVAELVFINTLLVAIIPLLFVSIISTISLSKIKGIKSAIFPVFSWLLIAVVPQTIFSEKWELFLLGLPQYITVTTIVVLVFIYLNTIKMSINIRKSEGLINAIG